MINEFGEFLTDDTGDVVVLEEPTEPENPDNPPIEPDDPEEPPEEPVEEDSEEIKTLKIRLREEDYPLFTNEELQYFIDSCDSLDMATYRAAILKSEANGLKLNGVEIESMSKFFLRIAAMYRPSNSGVLKG